MSCISLTSLQVFCFVSASSFPELLINSDWKLKLRGASGSLSVSAARKAVWSEDGSGVPVPGGAVPSPASGQSCAGTQHRIPRAAPAGCSAQVCCQISTRWQHFSTLLLAPDSCRLPLRGIQTRYYPGATKELQEHSLTPAEQTFCTVGTVKCEELTTKCAELLHRKRPRKSLFVLPLWHCGLQGKKVSFAIHSSNS